jgi:arginyl-tRNA synthetase
MNFIDKINKILQDAVLKTYPNSKLNIDNIKWEVPAKQENGDFASNISMILVKFLKKSPLIIANEILENIEFDGFEHIEVAKPGFINVKVKNSFLGNYLFENDITINKVNPKKVYIEYVSVNPTGPLHVGHGRNVIFGSILSKVFKTLGHDVFEEYYLNDAGRQMDILTISVLSKIFQTNTIENTYKGDYISEIANKYLNENKLEIGKYDSEFKPISTDAEQIIDEIIVNYKKILNEKYLEIFNFTLAYMVENIKEDLENFNINMHWFSEQSLLSTGMVDEMLSKIKSYCYTKEGALWFKATSFGDEKDRVLVRANKENTYFANDLAYHYYKLSTDYDLIINIWGSDHHGYLPRIEAGLKALNQDVNRLKVIFIQFVTLLNGSEKLQMSTRSGEFITFKDLADEISTSATKFFYSIRKQDQHLEFDLEVAKKQTNENPLYYIQYAHARICSILGKTDVNFSDITKEDIILNEQAEKELMLELIQFEKLLHKITDNYQLHLLPNYLLNLASKFHSYYNSFPVITDNKKITQSRLFLIVQTKKVIIHGLKVMNIEALTSM